MSEYCTSCNEECKAVEETFDYAGTHCSNGKDGTHHTGHYTSDCCGEEVSDVPKARVVFNNKAPQKTNDIEVWVGDDLIRSFNSLSDDHAYINANEYAKELNGEQK